MKVPETHLLYKEVDGERRLAVSYSQIDTFLTCPFKWYKIYIEGNRSTEKKQATSYGTVIHQTLEYFFNNRCLPKGDALSKAINYFAYKEEIPFESVKEQLIAMKQSGELLGWLLDLFDKDSTGAWKTPYTDLNPFEKLLRRGKIVGVEEDFVLPYKLPKPVDINGVVHTHVYIIGSVDLHLSIEHKGKIYHYVIDWKSGKDVFRANKLASNLQHPIYSFYVYRKYKEGLPDRCFYFFTRIREYQEIRVDEARKEKSIKMLNDIFEKMYDFENKSVEKFEAYVEIKARDGKPRYVRKPAKLPEPILQNCMPAPSALCYYCDFGMFNKKECPYSSNWDTTKKRKK